MVKHIKTVLTTFVLSILLPLLLTSWGFAQSTEKAAPSQQGKAKTNNTNSPAASKSSAQQPSKKPSKAKKGPAANPTTSPDKKKPVNVPAARRTELLKFCQQHHKELLPLLESLRKKRPEEFEKALRTLDREINQLQTVKSKDRYEKLLEQWVLRSKIKLLSAKLAVRASKEQRAKTTASLTKLIVQLQDLKIKHLSDEQQATRSRLAKITTQIDQLRETRDAEIKKQIDALTKNAERIQAAQKAKIAAKNKAKNSNKQLTTKQEPVKNNQAKKNQVKKPGDNKG